MGRQLNVTIRGRFKPFSHTPGARALIPLTDWVITAYPTRLEISDFFNEPIVIEMQITGPIQLFTLQQDLEQGVCRIFGEAKEGFFEWELFVDQKINVLTLRLARGKEMTLFIDGKKVKMHRNEALDLIEVPKMPSLSAQERISLGCHKKQDVEKMKQRNDLCEILPLLHFASQRVILPTDQRLQCMPRQESTFVDFVQTGFDAFLVPKRRDDCYLGIPCERLPNSVTPLYRLKAIQHTFRCLLIREQGGCIELLPNLPKIFPSGRMIGVRVPGGSLDFEWRKGKLRCVVVRSEQDLKLPIIWPKEIRAYRTSKQRGVHPREECLVIDKGTKRVVDKFQK